MAEDKKSFILYADLIHMVKKLPKEKQADLFMLILEYVNDENPITEDILLEIAFEPIKQQLKRDLKKYEGKKEKKSESAKLGNLKRWHVDLYDQVMEQKISIEEAYEIIANHRKPSHCDNSIANIAVNVNDNVNVTVNDNVNDILLEKETKEIFNEWLDYRKQIKKPLKSEKTLKALIKKINDNGLDFSRQVIKTSIENGWQGLFWEKPRININSKQKQKPQMLADKMKADYGLQ